MKIYTLQAEQLLPVSIAEAWEFFSDPRNLSVITPPELGFRITSELPPSMYAGMIITYKVTPVARVPIDWVTEITHVEAPYRFVDEQRFGPYRFWHHQHLFREVPGGTEARDLIHYALPLATGPFGWLVNRMIVGRQLAHIFAFRRRVLEERFGRMPDAAEAG